MIIDLLLIHVNFRLYDLLISISFDLLIFSYLFLSYPGYPYNLLLSTIFDIILNSGYIFISEATINHNPLHSPLMFIAHLLYMIPWGISKDRFMRKRIHKTLGIIYSQMILPFMSL